MSRIAWGVEEYVASADAADALRRTERAGPAARHDDDDELARHVADALTGLPFQTWDFGDSVAFEALVAASVELGDDRWERFVHGWGRAWATRSQPFVRLDCTAPGRALALVAHRRDDDRLLDALRALAGYLRERPTLGGAYETWESSPLLAPYGGAEESDRDRRLLVDPPAGVFLDCLHFDPPFFTTLGRITRDDDLFSDGIAQASAYVHLLQQSDGLFDHFVLRDEPGSFGSGWGRGQGWAALGLLEVLTEVRARGDALTGSPDAALFAEEAETLTAATTRLLRRMAGLQRPDGHWNAVVDRPESGDEYSTAAFMAVALATAAELGIGDVDLFTRAARRARRAILDALDRDGRLREVSAAVYASTVPDHYAAVPRGYVVPWGQGPALLALLHRRGGETS